MSHIVQIHETQQSFPVDPGESVLDAALRAGVELASECRFGGCGTCRIKLLAGSVEYEEYPMALTPEDEAQGLALACQARPSGNLLISTERTEPCAEPELHNAVVAGIRPLCEDVTHLMLELPDAPAPAHRPGQYLRIFTEDGRTRSFSMASAPNGRTVDLHVRRIPGGAFTDVQIRQLREGARLQVELPLGNFYYRTQDYRPLLLVATGTGVAPIKSMLEVLKDDPDCPPVALYWGARTTADLYLDEQIRAWGESFDDFTYVPVLSRADASWKGRTGYVQNAVADDMPDLSEHAIYLCGSPNMIRDARQTFMPLGASSSYLYTDGFTFQY